MPRSVKDGSLEVGGRTVQVSSVAKPFFPDAGLTKGDLIAHYRDVAEVMLPHLAGRPLNLQRFPNGINGNGFWQQGASEHFPDWVRTVTVERRGRGGTVDHVVCDHPATIVYLANLATVTFHAWTSTVEHLARPDLLIIDLDPDPDQELDVVRDAARAVRRAGEEIGLTPFVQTSGSRGYHVVMPLRPGPDVEETRRLADELALLVAARDPDRLSVEWRKASRQGRLLLDTARNGYAQTIVAPYSVRPKPEAPVATPIEWSELGRVEPRSYTMANLRRRLARKPDPWAGMAASAAEFEPVRACLDELLAEAGSQGRD
ncbi:MAG TPA: non-homologous end-joining DNA ligase [Actinomycetota bacterium]|jgi:bifunctional non-homologous end joining protein LigD|nr:non-homologous end-joining DNA ligase [Actinomycetota bacterium]